MQGSLPAELGVDVPRLDPTANAKGVGGSSVLDRLLQLEGEIGEESENVGVECLGACEEMRRGARQQGSCRE